MIFEDRRDAGQRLAVALKDYKNHENAILLALPRGGVVVADEIQKKLNLPLDLIVPRKIGHEHNPEFAIGAITETGEAVWDEMRASRASQDPNEANSPEYLKKIMAEEMKEAQRRLKTYRGDKPRDIKGKIAILIDDGVATGLTMRAAIKTAKSENPKKIIVAVPHGAPDSLDTIRAEVDEVIALDEPTPYGAVGAFYKEFEQTSDEEVIAIMKKV